MILLIFVLRHVGLCGILGDESLRPSIFCHQLNKYSAYLYINHCHHHHLSHEKYFYNTTKHFYLWVFSWGFKFWVIDVFRYHHCLSFLPKKKKKSKRRKKKEKKKKRKKKDIHNHSINHWCLTHLSCISEGLYGWVNVILIQVGCYCYELGWLEFSTFDSYTLYFKESSLPLPSHKIILPLSLKSYLILKVHGWYVFEIKTRDENGINLMFPRIQHPFQEIFFRCFSGCFCIHMWYS